MYWLFIALWFLLCAFCFFTIQHWSFRPIAALQDGTGFFNFFRVLTGLPRKFNMKADTGVFGATLKALRSRKTKS